jgi:hypothetical protein
MGSSKNNSTTKLSQLKSEQDQAAKMSLPNSTAAQLASFNSKDPFELVKFDKGTSAKDSGFTFKQNGTTFGSGTFDSQYSNVSQFDPNKDYKLQANELTKATRVVQGNLSFDIPNPVALTDPTDPATISPNAGSSSTASDASNTNSLVRTPRNVKTGALIGTASARAISGNSFNKTRAVGLKRPMLAGY